MSERFPIRRACPADAPAVGALMHALWPHHPAEELAAEAAALLAEDGSAVFLAAADGAPAGFLHCALRHDYVEGTDSVPVGYLEGLYVVPALRRRGIGRALVRAAEDWARARGCTEMGSDCALDNTLSPLFHAGAGFREAGRTICFVKRL